jgi:hypothetical protein
MAEIREGAWDCTQCNTKGIPGRLSKCSLCGDPRNPLLDPDERPYLPEDAPVVTDDEGLRLADLGPDWNCGVCGTSNTGNLTVCSNPDCKQPLDYDDNVAGVHTYVSGMDAIGIETVGADKLDEDRVDLVLEGADKLRALETTPLRAPSRVLNLADLRRRGIMDVIKSEPYRASVLVGGRSIPRSMILAGVVISAVLVALLGGGSWFYGAFIKTTTVELTVANMTWERQVEVEEFRTLTKEDWDYPGDARVISQRREIHHYVQVQTGTKRVPYTVSHQEVAGSHQERYACGSTTVDKGNGFFSTHTTYCSRTVTDYRTVYETKYRDEPVYRQDPVYKTKYVYEIDRWVTDRFDTAKGKSGVTPIWPATTANGSKERVGDERRQDYGVELLDAEGRSFTKSLGYERWSLLSEGEIVMGEQTRRGALRSVTWPSE